jgi:peptide/nickel transport system ATP-binding protein
LLDVRDPLTRFGNTNAGQGLDFTIQRGETLALVGASGCGKSATALSLSRLLPSAGRVVAGTVRFEGRDILRLSEPDLWRLRSGAISMIFQEPMTFLNPVLTIGRQITEAVREHQAVSQRTARARAVELLDPVRSRMRTGW